MTDELRRRAKNDLYRRLYGGTDTGRIPSSAPARGNDPKPPGPPLLDADYSALELRVLAGVPKEFRCPGCGCDTRWFGCFCDAKGASKGLVPTKYDRSTIAYFVDGPDPWDDWKPNRDIQ